jgi:hypothetical protein
VSVAAMDAMGGGGVHDGVGALDRAGQVVGVAEVTLEQFMGVSVGRTSSSPRVSPAAARAGTTTRARLPPAPVTSTFNWRRSLLVGRRPSGSRAGLSDLDDSLARIAAEPSSLGLAPGLDRSGRPSPAKKSHTGRRGAAHLSPRFGTSI